MSARPSIFDLPRAAGGAHGRVFRHTPFGTDGAPKPESATTFAWSEFRREARQIDGLGNERTFLFDKHGNPIAIADEAGARSIYSYDSAAGRTHLRIGKTDPQGMSTAYAYDSLGNLTDVTLPSARTLQYRDHTAYGQPRRVKDADGNWTLRRYDSAGNLTDIIRVKAGVIPVADTKPANADIVAWSQYQSDSVGNPVKTRTLRDWTSAVLGDANSGTGPSLETAWDASQLNPTSITCTVYTALGDVAEIWAGGTTDTVSKTCTLDGVAVKKQVARTYDDFGRKLSETDPNGKTWKWSWNLHNQLVSSQTPVQIAAGQSTVYAYGAKGQPGETQGQLKQRSVPGAQTAVYTRDALGFVTQAETKNGSNQTVVSYAYSYDPAKRLNTVTDSRGNKQLSYTWTPGGRLAKVEDSDGHQASMSYDATGRLASVVAPNGETIAFTYDAGGRLIETRLNSGQRTTQSWFEDGNLKQRQNLFNTTVLSSHLYTLDPQGRRNGQTENIAGTTKTWTYGYDNLDRLVSSSDGTAETYAYDIFGNRRSKTKSGTTTAYLYDAAHQLSEVRTGSDTGTLIGAAVHDADGHMVKLCEVSTGGTITKPTGDCTASGTGATTLALVWNALDHLNTATRTGTNAVAENYAYDDSGRRISKTSGVTTTSYLYDGDAIHAEWTGSISGNPAAAYVHGAGIDEPLLRLTGATTGPGATQAAYLQDGLGSVVGTTNVTGTLTANQRFDAWGNRTASSGTVPQYGYTGREPDATGLTFYRARYYHPGIARFASRDPMGMADAVSPYAYVANNPVNLIDPMGLEALLSGTPMSEAYWGMTADAGFYTGTQTDVRGGGNGGTFTPGQQRMPSSSGSGIGIAADIGIGFTPAGVAADLYGAVSGKTPFGGQELSGWERALGLIPGVSEGMAVFRGGVKGAGAVGDAVKAYDVGPANVLQNKSVVGDKLDIHHAGQSHPMSQVVPGYNPNTAPAIAVPVREHRLIPKTTGAYSGTARDQLAKDIYDLRNYTNAPNSSLQELIQLNKTLYPESFRKP